MACLSVSAGRPDSWLPDPWLAPVLAACALSLGGFAALARADTAYLASEKNRDGREKVTGTVVEYTGKELVVRRENGKERVYPGRRVLDIETEWLPEHVEADALLAKRDYAAALTAYRNAGKAEERRWVRRRILAGTIDCLRNEGRFEAAGRLFLALVHEDPDTPHFDVAPLAWQAARPADALAAQAQEWLTREDDPAAVLLGASHLLGGESRQAALDRLETLTDDKNPRIARLAEAQTWLAKSATAEIDRVNEWSARLAEIPPTLRAGPCLVVGKALARLQRHEEAAVMLLRVPILHPQETSLAAESLWQAGQSLERLDRPADAANLYNELLADFPQAAFATEAADRLRAMKKK